MKPRRLYRSPYTVPHLILRRAEAWACVVGPTLGTRDAVEAHIRDCKRRRFDLTLSTLYGVGWLQVTDHDCGLVAHRRWDLPPASADAPGGLAYDLARRRALSMWSYYSIRIHRSVTIEMEPYL